MNTAQISAALKERGIYSVNKIRRRIREQTGVFISGPTIKKCLEKNNVPRVIITKRSKQFTFYKISENSNLL